MSRDPALLFMHYKPLCLLSDIHEPGSRVAYTGGNASLCDPVSEGHSERTQEVNIAIGNQYIDPLRAIITKICLS